MIIRELEREIARLKKLVVTDPLTGLFNRRGFGEESGRLLKAVMSEQKFFRQRKEGLTIKKFSLIIFDLDNFKKLNDSLGHTAGDKALKLVAAMLRRYLRATDIAGRWGGEEFVVALPGDTLADAEVVAEHLRVKLNRLQIKTKKRAVRLSASFGVTELGQAGQSLEDLIERADRAMYQAKHLGKNRVVIFHHH